MMMMMIGRITWHLTENEYGHTGTTNIQKRPLSLFTIQPHRPTARR